MPDEEAPAVIVPEVPTESSPTAPSAPVEPKLAPLGPMLAELLRSHEARLENLEQWVQAHLKLHERVALKQA